MMCACRPFCCYSHPHRPTSTIVCRCCLFFQALNFLIAYPLQRKSKSRSQASCPSVAFLPSQPENTRSTHPTLCIAPPAAAMKLLTHNMLKSHVKGVKNGYPLLLRASETEVEETEFSGEFIARMLPRLEWGALVSAMQQVWLMRVAVNTS